MCLYSPGIDAHHHCQCAMARTRTINHKNKQDSQEDSFYFDNRIRTLHKEYGWG